MEKVMQRTGWLIFGFCLCLTGAQGNALDGARSENVPAGKGFLVNNAWGATHGSWLAASGNRRQQEIGKSLEREADAAAFTHLASNPQETAVSEQSAQSDNTSAEAKRQTGQPAVVSRKCAIYSGICLMNRPAEAGSYCVCHTPAGINYGVVIP